MFGVNLPVSGDDPRLNLTRSGRYRLEYQLGTSSKEFKEETKPNDIHGNEAKWLVEWKREDHTDEKTTIAALNITLNGSSKTRYSFLGSDPKGVDDLCYAQGNFLLLLLLLLRPPHLQAHILASRPIS